MLPTGLYIHKTRTNTQIKKRKEDKLNLPEHQTL
jgi:hypothetical protein